MNQEIALFKNFGLATPSSIAYSESMNAFVTTAQAFPSGNAYGCAARFAKDAKIVVVKKPRGIRACQQLEIAFV